MPWAGYLCGIRASGAPPLASVACFALGLVAGLGAFGFVPMWYVVLGFPSLGPWPSERAFVATSKKRARIAWVTANPRGRRRS